LPQAENTHNIVLIAGLGRLDEIKALLVRVAKHSVSSLNRRDALARLEQACIGQRTLTDFFSMKKGGPAGSSSLERLMQELAVVLEHTLGHGGSVEVAESGESKRGSIKAGAILML
jgi:hypothetical protein